ncbi:MAG: LysR family transcriptional regulator [Candidatus Anaerobiospirillum merdipullorum]|uniref:LysR family transcriptional regulator n=1 Tax=Candidatus Anaerobiospirillum merdipullorum TaxID=2838450 RepID=A0A9E2NRW5_9GAMM|nr:LysR family transcriptional regulator [Candidatus Anaerobiospirillum merdipullorum]
MAEDFRLRVFTTAARTLSFKQAADELCITQPAVSKHIHALEELYQVRLFERLGNKLSLTPAGLVMREHAEKILTDYATLSYAMHLFTAKTTGTIRLGASTTIAQYLLPPILAAFNTDYPQVEISLLTSNSRHIEKALTTHEIELGLVEGVFHAPGLIYQPLMQDELCIIAPYDMHLPACLSLEQFCAQDFVLREHGSGTLDVIAKELQRHGIKLSSLPIKLHLGSSEGIKLFLQHRPCLSIVSRLAVASALQRHELKELTVPQLNFTREFNLVLSPGPISPLTQRCMDFIRLHCAPAAR